MAREIQQRLVVRFFVAVEMALQFHVDVLCAEHVEDVLVGTCGEADQALGEFGEFFGSGRAFAFLGAQLHAGDQAAEILIAFSAFG